MSEPSMRINANVDPDTRQGNSVVGYASPTGYVVSSGVVGVENQYYDHASVSGDYANRYDDVRYYAGDTSS